MTAAAIAVDGLVKRYGDRSVIDGVSFEVGPGEIVALLGPNGAGKTTTVEIIEGYRQADGGAVRVLGAEPGRAGREHRARVGLMLQGGGIDMRARPAETIRQYARFHADPLDPGELLDTVGLTPVASTPYRRLSGGERQRLGLALAMVGRPDVVILDEPTAGMDPEARAIVRGIIAGLRDRGVATLLTSHDLIDVERLADRVVVLARGRVAAQGSPAELAASQTSRLWLRLDRPLDADGRDALAAAIGASIADGGDGRLVIEAVPDPRLVAAVAAWCAAADRLVVELHSGEGDLEGAYLRLTAAEADR